MQTFGQKLLTLLSTKSNLTKKMKDAKREGALEEIADLETRIARLDQEIEQLRIQSQTQSGHP
jgi:hypothetical protein